MSGYDLKRAFDTSVRHFWTADQAAIYRALAELEGAGLVEHERIAQAARPDRKEFVATPTGRAEFERWLAAPTPTVVRREPLLVKLFFAGQLQPAAIRSIVDTELAQVREELGALVSYVAMAEQQAAGLDGAERTRLLGPLLTLTNGLRLGLAYRDWLAGLSAATHAGTLTVESLLDEVHRLTMELGAT